MKNKELILELGGEGGSISLLRVTNGDEIRYFVETNESYLEDDFYHSENSYSTFEDAVKRIYLKYPIFNLHLIEVQLDYIIPIGKAIQNNTHLKHENYDISQNEADDQKFHQNLIKISQQEWQELSRLLVQTKSFDANVIEHDREAGHILSEIYVMVDEIKIVSPFDWGCWDEGRWLINASGLDFNTLDTVTLAKLVTAVNRNERFCEGAWESSFENHLMQQILQALIDKNMNASIFNNL